MRSQTEDHNFLSLLWCQMYILSWKVSIYLAGVRLDFFHATDFEVSEHSVEKVYEVYILFELNWSAVFIGIRAASYKRFGPGESDF